MKPYMQYCLCLRQEDQPIFFQFIVHKMELYSDYKNVTHYITDMKSLLSNAFGGFMAETANPRGALDNDALHAYCVCVRLEIQFILFQFIVHWMDLYIRFQECDT